jgi:hypothetical protein
MRWSKIFATLPLGEFIYGSTALESKPVSRRPVLIWLIISQLLALASLVFWLFAAGISVMAFDSGSTPEAWTFVIAVWSYPVWPILFTIAAWIAYARKKDRLAAVLTTLTFLPVLILILVIVLANFFYWFRLSNSGLF